MAIPGVDTGLDTAQQPLLIDSQNAALQTVNEKIGRVYLYTAAGFAASCVSASLFALSGLTAKAITLLAGANPLAVCIGLVAVGVALIAAIHFTPIIENNATRHGLFGLFTVYQGLVVSPLVLINAPVFAAAAAMTVGITGGLGALALKIQTQFERFEKIMLVALGVIAVASLGSLFLTGTAGVFAHQVSLIGGFALFGALVIYDTQKVRQEAEDSNRPFDVIKHALNIYQDAMNLLIRLFEIMDSNRREQPS